MKMYASYEQVRQDLRERRKTAKENMKERRQSVVLK